MSHSIPNSTEQSNIPYGYCQCGCGQLAPIAKKNDRAVGPIKGESLRFISGHNCTTKAREPFIEPDLPSGVRAIQLTQGKFAIVDAADYEWLSQWKWRADKSKRGRPFYAVRTVREGGKRHTLPMHREILGVSREMEVDHKDGDSLNNTRGNLRPATDQQNRFNQSSIPNSTSVYKGVNWMVRNRKWRARIEIGGKTKHLGLFADEVEAAKAYDVAAREYHGEFARLNFQVTP